MSTGVTLPMAYFSAWPIQSHCQSILVLLNDFLQMSTLFIIFFLFHILHVHWDSLPVVVVVVVDDDDDVIVCRLQLQ